MFPLLPFQRKLALGTGGVALAVAALGGIAAGLIAHDKAEDTLVAQATEDTVRLLRHEDYRPVGAQATLNARAAAHALAASYYDIARLYTPGGLLLAEEFGANGQALDAELPARAAPSYTQSWYERRWLPGRRAVLRLFIALRNDEQALSGYFEGARRVPEAQRQRMLADARRVGWLTAAAVLLCGLALYPLVLQLNRDSQRRQRELLESHIAMMEALGRAIARRDSDNGVHNYRVAWISAKLAEAVGVHGTRMQELIVGSFLHDVGKIGIPEHILLKPAALSNEEMLIMHTHVGMGEDIVAGAGWLAGGRAVVASHHEKWDGSGYPRGLSGTDIPTVARIFAIADVFDALCSRRPYKEPLPLEAALQAVRDESGRHFDPHLVQVFDRLAPEVYRTLTESSEEELQALLTRMVRKHFSL
ncbi:MAG: HD-GYP domain-containing protein [Curvibacter sp.]|nr:HD domain-containing protein [Curvibacter sp.]